MSSPLDYYTFVVLIDIVYTDSTKRICTGSIIHDNVVLTAAHCFVKNDMEDLIKAELTTSFVVIGTKKMYASNYEQYLPIERVLLHPEFNLGWTADIALVYTFAGMTGDKPGHVVPFISEEEDQHNSSVFIISWGAKRRIIKSKSTTPCSKLMEKGSSKKKKTHKTTTRNHAEATAKNKSNIAKPIGTRLKLISRIRSKEHEEITTDNAKSETNISKNSKDFVPQNETKIKSGRRINSHKYYYKNFRRVMGETVNQLDYEQFNFAPIQTCKVAIDKAMPSVYTIKNDKETLCFTSDDHYITDKDSGAPAILQGTLVAVVVGGVESHSEHRVSVGVKISCFCPWIVEKLPSDGQKLNCCESCCTVNPLS